MAQRSRVVNRFNEHAPLSRQAIARAAEYIVANEGLAALTMRRLGRELGVEAMSIYHHIANKPALIDLLVERQLQPVAALAARTSVEETLEEIARQLYTSLTSRSEMLAIAAPIAARLVPDSPPAIGAAAQLVEAGFDPQAAGWIVEAFVGLAIGHALAYPNLRIDDDDQFATLPGFETGLQFMLTGLRAEME